MFTFAYLAFIGLVSYVFASAVYGILHPKIEPDEDNDGGINTDPIKPPPNNGPELLPIEGHMISWGRIGDKHLIG
jgi:hypothetical protein